MADKNFVEINIKTVISLLQVRFLTSGNLSAHHMVISFSDIIHT